MDQNTESEKKVEEEAEKPETEDEVQGASGGSSWWGGYSSWMDKAVNSVQSSVNSAAQLAKQKSTEVYGLVSKDLEEVSTQATSMVKSSSMTLKKTLEMDWYYADPCTSLALCGDDICIGSDLRKVDEKSDELADQAYESVKSSVTSAWRYAAGYATQMFTEEDLEAEALLVQGEQEPLILNRLQAQLYALATDPETFLTDPIDEVESWKTWKSDLEKRQGEISDLMVNNPNIRKNYSQLVPDKVNHNLFWDRYFFKVHLIELQENKRQVLKKRAEQVKDEEINWEEFDEDSSKIPDEVQDKLLKDYEKELKAESSLKKELNIKEKQNTPDKEETSSDDWERLSSGEKSPRKQSKEEEEEWVQP